MVRLAGEVADGAALNWCTPDQVAWSRRRVAEAAEAAGRDPGAVKLAEYIRVCVDDDVDAARIALAKAALGYAMGPGRSAGEKPMGYRAHFERMGFAAELAELDRMRDQGCGMDELAAACPEEMLLRVGYFGKAEGAAKAIRRLAEGLDVAIVRVVVARAGRELRPGNHARRTPRPGLRVGLRLSPFESPCVHRRPIATVQTPVRFQGGVLRGFHLWQAGLGAQPPVSKGGWEPGTSALSELCGVEKDLTGSVHLRYRGSAGEDRRFHL